MSEIRKLVYEERTGLGPFGVYEDGSLNNVIFHEWLLWRSEIDPFEKNHLKALLKVFNDAFYVCTLALLLPTGKNMLLVNIQPGIDNPSIVFPLVCFYLSKLTSTSLGITDFIKSMESGFRRKLVWQQNYDDLKAAAGAFEGGVDPSLFGQRELTEEVLSSVDWQRLTKCFSKEEIEQVVRNFARKPEDWQLMCEAIKAAAQRYDYEFGFEEYEQECFDEDSLGLYTQIIKVPIDPCDAEGNDISEPLRRAGVYQFCDELKEKFDELSVRGQICTEPGIGRGRRPSEPRQRKREGYSIFHENLNPQAIAEALMDLKQEFVVGQKQVSERPFFKMVHNAFIQLKWLNDAIATHFIKWLHEERIMLAKTPDFKNINYVNEDLSDAVLNKFSEVMPNSKRKDYDEFYLKTPQGDTLRKINKG